MVHCSLSRCLRILRQHCLLPLHGTFLPPKCPVFRIPGGISNPLRKFDSSPFSDVSQCSPPHQARTVHAVLTPLTAMATGCQGLLLLCHGSMPRFGAGGLGTCHSFLLHSSQLTTECKWTMVFSDWKGAYSRKLLKSARGNINSYNPLEGSVATHLRMDTPYNPHPCSWRNSPVCLQKTVVQKGLLQCYSQEWKAGNTAYKWEPWKGITCRNKHSGDCFSSLISSGNFPQAECLLAYLRRGKKLIVSTPWQSLLEHSGREKFGEAKRRKTTSWSTNKTYNTYDQSMGHCSEGSKENYLE